MRLILGLYDVAFITFSLSSEQFFLLLLLVFTFNTSSHILLFLIYKAFIFNDLLFFLLRLFDHLFILDQPFLILKFHRSHFVALRFDS